MMAQQQQMQQQMMQFRPMQPAFPVAQPLQPYPFQPAGHLQPPQPLVPAQPAGGYGFNNGSANHIRGNPQSQPYYGSYQPQAALPYGGVQYPQQQQMTLYPNTII